MYNCTWCRCEKINSGPFGPRSRVRRYIYTGAVVHFRTLGRRAYSIFFLSPWSGASCLSWPASLWRPAAVAAAAEAISPRRSAAMAPTAATRPSLSAGTMMPWSTCVKWCATTRQWTPTSTTSQSAAKRKSKRARLAHFPDCFLARSLCMRCQSWCSKWTTSAVPTTGTKTLTNQRAAAACLLDSGPRTPRPSKRRKPLCVPRSTTRSEASSAPTWPPRSRTSETKAAECSAECAANSAAARRPAPSAARRATAFWKQRSEACSATFAR
mmetsp:Transcript_13575/g.47284  ORF Transcript_13575/g.47284 Transcript_13575/m.47284 type:complete len:269 (-) Transcript_13575:643-1449(-)